MHLIFLQVALTVSVTILSALGATLNLIQLYFIIQRIRSKKRLPLDYFLISLSLGDLYRCTIGTGVWLVVVRLL